MTIELWGLECTGCKHAYPDMSGCGAFPEGIPWELKSGERSHRYPYPGDRGIRYEPEDDSMEDEERPRTEEE